MAWMLDTNIFIISIYNPLDLKAFKKFISSNNAPIPGFLMDEIQGKIYELHFLLQKILNSTARRIQLEKINELKELEKYNSNIFNFLKQKSNNFKNISVLQNTIEKALQKIHDIDSWASQIKCYPSNEHNGNEILKKYKTTLKELKK